MASANTPRVTPLVRRVWHATRLACTAEALLLGAGLSLLTLAAAWSSGAGFGWTALGLALMAGTVFGTAWRIEQRPQLHGVARGVDEGLRLGGALVTAFESEQSGADGSLVRLLSLRVRSRVRVVAALRAALPNSLPFLAAPLLGTVVLLSVRSGGEEPPPPATFLAPALGAMADALAEAKRMGFEDVASGLTSQEDASLLADLEREARAGADEIVKKARQQIEAEKVQALQDIRDQVVDLAVEITKQIVDKAVDREDHLRIAAEMIPRVKDM